MDKQKMIDEGVRRMEALKMLPQPIKEFKENQLVNRSEHGGILFGLMKQKKRWLKK